MAKIIKPEHIHSILIDDDGSLSGTKGKMFISTKEGVKIEDIAEELKLEAEPECEDADDCQKKYGDPPFGMDWFCLRGRCYYG